MIKLFFTFLTIFLLSSATFAQQTSNVIPQRIAFINKLAFDNEKTGIIKLTKAWDQSYRINCYPLHQSEIFEIEKELENSNLSPDERKNKETYLKTLKDAQEENGKKRWEDYHKKIVDPILSEISDLIKKVEIQNNIIIFDGAELEENGQLLSFDERFDITKQFIAYFNNKSLNPNEVLEISISETKIALINTELFYDKQKGIKSLSKLADDPTEAKRICVETSICGEVGKALNSFARAKGFSFVLDSSQTIAPEMSVFQMTDITQEFILKFNESNQ